MQRADRSDTPLDAEEILKVLGKHSVDYVIIGGLAVQTHGHVRTTVDIDILPKPDPQNLQRLAAALNELEARVLNPGSEGVEITAKALPRATLWQLTTLHGAVDILHDAPGAPPYDLLRKNALEIDLDGLKIAIAGLDDLISMKRSSGRQIDLEDIAALSTQFD